MLFQRAIIVTIDADNAEDADFTAKGMAAHIAIEQNRHGCENETAFVGSPEHDNEGQQVFYADADPDTEPDEPSCTYPSDLDTTGRVY